MRLICECGHEKENHEGQSSFPDYFCLRDDCNCNNFKRAKMRYCQQCGAKGLCNCGLCGEKVTINYCSFCGNDIKKCGANFTLSKCQV